MTCSSPNRLTLPALCSHFIVTLFVSAKEILWCARPPTATWRSLWLTSTVMARITADEKFSWKFPTWKRGNVDWRFDRPWLINLSIRSAPINTTSTAFHGRIEGGRGAERGFRGVVVSTFTNKEESDFRRNKTNCDEGIWNFELFFVVVVVVGCCAVFLIWLI